MSTLFLTLCWTATAGLAGGLTWLAVAAIKPWLTRRALARPNARSSHVRPTPQGAGLAVVPVAILVAVCSLALSDALPRDLVFHVAAAAVGALVLMAVGIVDDIRSLPIAPRLAAQLFAVACVVLTLPSDIRILPGLVPIEVERGLAVLAGLWFVNLSNFMDGIDLMSVAETVAVSFGVVVLALLGLVPAWLGWIAASLAGAVLGFAPWNSPPAKLFLGDAGSLGMSVLIGLLLLHVAGAHALAAAVILPLYYLVDATFTVARRMVRGEKIWQAHRDHFYQRALRGGRPVGEIIGAVCGLNAALIVLAVLAAFATKIGPTLLILATAVAAVAVTLRILAVPRR